MTELKFNTDAVEHANVTTTLADLIVAAKFQDQAVTTAKIGTGELTADKFAAGIIATVS